MGIKCVVWDLDNTVWAGTLAESDELVLRPDVKETLKWLDERGILNSIASRNSPEEANRKLEEFGIAEFFLSPQIGWAAKSESVSRIAEHLGIGIDTLVFLDDEPFERYEVTSAHPRVQCFSFVGLEGLLNAAKLHDLIVTPEGRMRRQLYRFESQRRIEEGTFTGTSEEFLAKLDLRLEIRRATEDDLERAEELVRRTNQLNSTGHIYSMKELRSFIRSEEHEILMASLVDRFGSYGNIGVAVLEMSCHTWSLKLFLMSCRVLARGVGGVFLAYLANSALQAGVVLNAIFRRTPQNRIMLVTYKFGGFTEVGREAGSTLFRYTAEERPLPPYVELIDLAELRKSRSGKRAA